MSVPGRFVTGDELSEEDEPELTPEVAEGLSLGKKAVSPGSHDRGMGDRTDIRCECIEDDGVEAAGIVTVNSELDDDVSVVRKESGVVSVQGSGVLKGPKLVLPVQKLLPA